MKDTRRLNKRTLDKLSKDGAIGENIWDDQLAGFHVRIRKGALSLRVSYYNQLGQRRVLTLGRYGTMSADKAREAAREVLALVQQGKDPRAVQEESQQEAQRQQTQTLEAYLDGPYTVFQSRKKDGKGTLSRIRRDFDGWLKRPISSLSRSDVEIWQADQEAIEKPKAFLTLKRSYDALHALFEHAAERKVIPENPLKGVKLQKPAMTPDDIAEQASKRRYLDRDEVKALFLGLNAYQDDKREQRRNSRSHGKAYLPSLDELAYVDHVEPWILTMFYTGFRPGDLMGLRWEEVNLTHGNIRKVIEKTAHHNPEPMVFPLSGSALEVLKTWQKQQGEPKTGLVFPSPVTGKRMDKMAMQKPWRAIKKLSGLPIELALYSLRHNFASHLVMAGVDLLTVSRLMAHTDIQTTIKHYAHLRPDHTRDAVEKFDREVKFWKENKVGL